MVDERSLRALYYNYELSIDLTFQSPCIGQPGHTGYLRLHPGVLLLMAFSGLLDEDTRIPKITIQTTNQPNFILAQEWAGVTLTDPSA